MDKTSDDGLPEKRRILGNKGHVKEGSERVSNSGDGRSPEIRGQRKTSSLTIDSKLVDREDTQSIKHLRTRMRVVVRHTVTRTIRPMTVQIMSLSLIAWKSLFSLSSFEGTLVFAIGISFYDYLT